MKGIDSLKPKSTQLRLKKYFITFINTVFKPIRHFNLKICVSNAVISRKKLINHTYHFHLWHNFHQMIFLFMKYLLVHIKHRMGLIFTNITFYKKNIIKIYFCLQLVLDFFYWRIKLGMVVFTLGFTLKWLMNLLNLITLNDLVDFAHPFPSSKNYFSSNSILSIIEVMRLCCSL